MQRLSPEKKTKQWVMELVERAYQQGRLDTLKEIGIDYV